MYREGKIILKGRQCGKTTELLEMAHDTNLIIVVLSNDNAAQLFKRAREQGYNIKRPITYADVISRNGRMGTNISGFLFDNFDQYIMETVRKLAHITRQTADVKAVSCGTFDMTDTVKTMMRVHAPPTYVKVQGLDGTLEW